MVKFSDMSRGQAAAVVIAVVVFVVGLVTVIDKLGSAVPAIVHTVASVGGHGPTSGNSDTVVNTINNANFDYLVPGSSDAWTFDDKSTAYDQTKGLVKYDVIIKDGNVQMAISQQVMPDQLKDSSNFTQFISDSKPYGSQSAGSGKVYFLPADVNDQSSTTNANMIIYSTDNILLFGQASNAIDDGTWVTLLSSMHAH